MSEAGVYADGRLADELAAILGPKLQDALNHPTRRDVLRVLHAGDRPSSLTAILAQLAPLKCGEVGYHVKVLRDSGAVLADGTRPDFGGRDALYRSVLADDPQACAVLRATEREDRRRRQAAKRERSPSLLAMFRIPHPERAIRLDLRRGRKASQ